MIEIDMPMPDYCSECPCSYYVRSGKYEGNMMCQALEFKESRMGIRRYDKGRYLVREREWDRPDKCPITVEILLRTEP